MSLFEPFGFAFFRNGLAVSVLAGAVCGLVGVFVVLRHMSYIGHGDRKSTRLNSSHSQQSRMPSSA